jgi:transcriptional regulator GlxA family with amidase domain
MQIAIPLFDDLTALDAIGPYEVLSRLPGAQVVFVGAEKRAYVTDNGMLRMHADATLDDVPAPDILCIPGGVGVQRELDGPIVSWIRSAHRSTTWTTSVCTGALLLGAAGVLDGLRATTHWLSLERLRAYGASPTGERVVEQGRVVTAAGVSAGLDMALLLAGRIAGDDAAQAIQLSLEYDPQPPFDAGAPEKAPAAAVALVRAAVADREARASARATGLELSR